MITMGVQKATWLRSSLLKALQWFAVCGRVQELFRFLPFFTTCSLPVCTGQFESWAVSCLLPFEHALLPVVTPCLPTLWLIPHFPPPSFPPWPKEECRVEPSWEEEYILPGLILLLPSLMVLLKWLMLHVSPRVPCILRCPSPANVCLPWAE